MHAFADAPVFRRLLAPALLAALLAQSGCGSVSGYVPTGLEAAVPGYTGKKKENRDPSTEALNFTTSPGEKSPGGEGTGYTMSAEELAYDCKKLTGKMQVRIIDMRGYAQREKTTLASRTLHATSKMIIGGTNTGLNTDAQFAKDKSMLEAYNKQLVAKDCPSYNIGEALSGTGLPSPTVAAPSKAKAQAAKNP